MLPLSTGSSIDITDYDIQIIQKQRTANQIYLSLSFSRNLPCFKKGQWIQKNDHLRFGPNETKRIKKTITCFILPALTS